MIPSGSGFGVEVKAGPIDAYKQTPHPFFNKPSTVGFMSSIRHVFLTAFLKFTLSNTLFCNSASCLNARSSI